MILFQPICPEGHPDNLKSLFLKTLFTGSRIPKTFHSILTAKVAAHKRALATPKLDILSHRYSCPKFAYQGNLSAGKVASEYNIPDVSVRSPKKKLVFPTKQITILGSEYPINILLEN